ncbi:ATPase components of ABC transporters with duplicated ATPase domains [Elusimicrobium minutum Pei191]|uniref:ATPase components of ABC transporters with duplicated ATPase domains n=1 Tax=Elusimicrobium minutum (strain Pei191) TaxID=445932 RepID=B2KBT8_ELUMP|nr:ATP-binding cassette domain-containing protein [Elusimicrobium minutum]ACC97842.1 ATPase components of ABC transporters with duplicated ATPase domains [Elusimicrobium minutum Pei191]
MHTPLKIKNLSLYFKEKVCFENFNTDILYGDRIAIIGRNGSGKSSLIKIISGLMEQTEGEVLKDKGIVIGYVPQTVMDYDSLSGGQRFNKALTEALALNLDILLLDEPTNHLDLRNRRSLMAMLKHYYGTLIMVSHDVELLNGSVNTLWHIDSGQINIFNGKYDDYFNQMQINRHSLENELENLKKEKRLAHKDLMKEQKRAKSKKEHGINLNSSGKWAPIVAGGKKRQAENTAGRKNKEMKERQDDVNSKLSSLYITDVIKPKFSLTSEEVDKGAVVIVTDGAVGYEDIILRDINFSLTGSERIAITGDNASGKTTILRAIVNDPAVKKQGFWTVPSKKDIGYLDQHYKNLNPDKTVFETVGELLPGFTHAQVRDFLNDFLFRKQEEVNSKVSVLSGGEKARLSLAVISAKTPKLLILDEITNNVDLETKNHIIQALNEYPAAVIAVSHEPDFLNKIGIIRYYDISKS